MSRHFRCRIDSPNAAGRGVTAPSVGVLALQGDVREHAIALRDCGADVVTVRTVRELNGLDGLVIPGGESTTMSKLAADLGLLEPIKDAVAGGLAVYGSCAGMILVAREVLDGIPDQQTLSAMDIVVRRNAFGRQVASFEQDLDMPSIGAAKFRGVFIRAPWIESVGDDVEVLAVIPNQTPGGRIVAVRQQRVIATAFHPELTDDRRIHSLFVDIVKGHS